MSTHEPWPKRAVLWLLLFWLPPLAWALKKVVFLAYVRTIKASGSRQNSPGSVPILPMK